MVTRPQQKRVSGEQLAITRSVIGPTVKITTGEGDSFEADLTSIILPLTVVPRFTQSGLDLMAHQRLSPREFFKTLRAAKYLGEWEWLTSLPGVGAREWKMMALSFCSQVAIECTLIYPFLEPEPRNWLHDKFVRQGVPDNFNSRWDAYLNDCGRDLSRLEGRIYLHVGEHLRFKWFGDIPSGPESEQYRMAITTGDL